MPSPTICTVSGTVKDATGTAISGVTVKASAIKPFIHSTDSSLITNTEALTTTASDGTWSLNLVETTTDSVTMTVTFIYTTGSNNPNDRRTYTILVPNSASSTFAALVSGQ